MEFMTRSVPYLEKVAMRDEEFFIGDDKPQLLEALNIKKLWTDDLSPVTKQAIWRYIQSFFTVGMKVVEMPVETHPIINYIIIYQELSLSLSLIIFNLFYNKIKVLFK